MEETVSFFVKKSLFLIFSTNLFGLSPLFYLKKYYLYRMIFFSVCIAKYRLRYIAKKVKKNIKLTNIAISFIVFVSFYCDAFF